MRFSGKTAVVTGASAGIGRTIARALAAEGARVVIVDQAAASEAVEEVRALAGAGDALMCDIRSEESVAAMADRVTDLLGGRLDVLVNNAGVNGRAQLVMDMPLDSWNHTLQVNLTGTMLVTRSLAPMMIARSSGSIVNIASNVSRRGLPYRADYVASKWALLGFTQTLALELAASNVRVNAVCPGPVNGDRIELILADHAAAENRTAESIRDEWQAASPMNRFIEPREVAEVVLFLASTQSSAMTGQALNVTAGQLMN